MTTSKLTLAIAERLAAIALGHVRQIYPNKLDHVLSGPEDLKAPQDLHPIFYGSFDWHSSVHTYWLLARLLRLFPKLKAAQQIRALFDDSLTPAKIEGEVAYLARPSARGFERPYGWAWALALVAELARHETAEGRKWHGASRPLGAAFADRFVNYLPLADYPVRSGAHGNTAFALIHALDYAKTVKDQALWDAVFDAGVQWYGEDASCQAWEPDGDAFLSPALTEAALMSDLILPEDFSEWLDDFLPDLDEGRPENLFTPVKVSDRTDGKIAHLDGLNLSRAWAFGKIAAALGEDHTAYDVLAAAREAHLAAAMPHLDADYMGAHWLASFAALALDVAL